MEGGDQFLLIMLTAIIGWWLMGGGGRGLRGEAEKPAELLPQGGALTSCLPLGLCASRPRPVQLWGLPV